MKKFNIEYIPIPIKTKYWRPGDDYTKIIIEELTDKIKDGDILTVSEKAISVAKGRLIDESKIKPSLLAKSIAFFWMRYVWGYILAPLCHLKLKNVYRLRKYPFDVGSTHKQTALMYAGFFQALRHGSEGGIDVSNIPLSYACLPLPNPSKEAKKISAKIESVTGKKIFVMIVDTDMTYSWYNFHFTPLKEAIKGIVSAGGFVTYVLGRSLRLKYHATPVGVSSAINVSRALYLAQLAHRTRKSGAGSTAWDVAERFNVDLISVTWEMLEEVEHNPIVLIRPIRT